MKNLLLGASFLLIFGLCLYFFLINSETVVSVRFFGEVSSPQLPLGMLILITFFAGFVGGLVFYPLTQIIKRIS